MKKRIKLLLILILIGITIMSGCEFNKLSIIDKSLKKYKTLTTEDYNNVDLKELSKYEINVEFNPKEKTYAGNQKITYVNNEDKELEKLYFHLYPNAFKRKETAPFLFDNFNSAFPDGFKSGCIEITKLTVNNNELNYNIFGKGDTILKIVLNHSLKPGDSTEIYMEFNVVMPSAQDRFGYGDKTFNFGNWYPIAAVYDDEGWNLDPYYNIGDPFYSDVGNYEVNITGPKDYKIASTGNIISEKEKNDKKTWKIEAKLVRDFAWVASKYFRKLERDIDGIQVKLYFLEENKPIIDFTAEVCHNALTTFNKVFGKYPYGQYSVVACDFPSGMEYPGIVFIGQEYYKNHFKKYLETVIAHETGHQWWYGVVGNDEIDEAWLDESLTVYSEVIYANENYGEEFAENYYETNIKGNYEYAKPLLESNEVIAKSLNKFNNWDDYSALVYSKGAMFIHEIEKEYGEETLYKIFKEYFNRYRFLIATTEDFIEVCEDVTGDEFDLKVDKWLLGNE